MITKIGLDLGYANIALSNVASEVYREPSVALIDKNTRHIIAVGNRAVLSGEEVLPGSDGMLVRPFKNGLLYSADITKEIISNAVSSLDKENKIRCVLALPSDFLPKQELEIFKMLEDAGISEVMSVKPAVAALVGAGYSPSISAISVNVGAAYTEIAVMHKGNVLISARDEVGGENFDIAVKEYISRQGDMTVSLLVARTIKERLGAVWKGRASETIDIEGVLSLTGSHVKMRLSTEDIVGVFEKPLQKLLNAIASAVKKIPLEYVQDIFENGIILSGGASQLYGLDTMIAKVFGIYVTIANSPIDCVAKGLSRINSFVPSKHRLNRKNITSQLSKLYEDKKSKSNND